MMAHVDVDEEHTDGGVHEAPHGQDPRPVQPQSYLEALVGGTAVSSMPEGQPPSVDLSVQSSPSVDLTPIVSTCTVSASGGSMSGSITNPEFAKRNRSVSFS